MPWIRTTRRAGCRRGVRRCAGRARAPAGRSRATCIASTGGRIQVGWRRLSAANRVSRRRAPVTAGPSAAPAVMPGRVWRHPIAATLVEPGMSTRDSETSAWARRGRRGEAERLAQAESERFDADTARREAELDRLDAEAARKRAEAMRVVAQTTAMRLATERDEALAKASELEEELAAARDRLAEQPGRASPRTASPPSLAPEPAPEPAPLSRTTCAGGREAPARPRRRRAPDGTGVDPLRAARPPPGAHHPAGPGLARSPRPRPSTWPTATS